MKMKTMIFMLWANAALATPLIPEIITPHNSLSRRAPSDTSCPSAYTSENGLRFKTYCNQNNAFNDALDPFVVATLDACLEHCSRYQGTDEGCFGVAWSISSGDCWIKNSTTSQKDMVNSAITHSALSNADDMKPLDTDCPTTDLAVESINGVAGMGYTVHCGKIVPLGMYDLCFQGYGNCLPGPFNNYYHATSLEGCLEHCLGEHPLCNAVSYNPGLEVGYPNCWLKTMAGNSFVAPPTNMGIMHTAAITRLDTISTTCPKNSRYTTTSTNKQFDIQCGKININSAIGSSNITSVHSQNLTSCLDTCGSNKKNCVGVVFDPSLSTGFNNCYLQNQTWPVEDKASVTYAALNGVSPSTSSATSSPSSKSKSKAWIAGPVVGSILVLAIIGAALLWWRRRKAKAASGAQGGMGQELSGNGVGTYNGYGGPQEAKTQYAGYAAVPNAPSELPSQENQVQELDAASKMPPHRNGPAELPS
ncbi:hypothetical protein K504DRAFT_460782 [Pleomassaria siparia CBS 279.74]|uniref:Apple domain-containing protein n=1 Tax=Pleomassaria siparia CBS 279.74 TaxID=1314801 RepID=A0A6G1JXU9_9PLEO|nr:hypothetical protein K504DRAFT_460782 [Pleomassaria siparia CBS 279.74]